MENNTEKEFEKHIFKHYFKAKSAAGFLSITPFNEGAKFKIEVGETTTDNKLIQVTSTYVNFVNLAAYLRSVLRNTAETVYWDNGSKSPATLVVYGGATLDGVDTARILKVTPMFDDFNNKVYKPSLPFQWKCGHFKAKKTYSGGFQPMDMKSPIQQNTIKITRQTMEEISYIVDTHILKVELGAV